MKLFFIILINQIKISTMDSEELCLMLQNNPSKFTQILSKFLDETSDDDIQCYNTFDDLENFTNIWLMIKDCYNTNYLAVKFIKKIMAIKKEDPQKNKFMMGFANNSENTCSNMRLLYELDQTLPCVILNKYTIPEKLKMYQMRNSWNLYKKDEPLQQEPLQQEPLQQEPLQQEPLQQEPLQQEPPKHNNMFRTLFRNLF